MHTFGTLWKIPLPWSMESDWWVKTTVGTVFGILENTTCPFVEICRVTLGYIRPTLLRNKIREVISDKSTQVMMDSSDIRDHSSPSSEVTISSHSDVVLVTSTSVVTKLDSREVAVDANDPDSRLIDVVSVVEATTSLVGVTVVTDDVINGVSKVEAIASFTENVVVTGSVKPWMMVSPGSI